MTLPRLTYFDAPISRGEECRLALAIAGVEFHDNRLGRDAWLALKPMSPFGGLPIFEVPGHPPLAQVNAILELIGRLHGLHPADPWEAARHLAMMCHVEDLRAHVSPILRIADPEEKPRARQALAEGYLPTWAANAEKHLLGDGPFFAGDRPHVVDLKLHMAVRWFASGNVDHVPATIFGAYPRLNRVHDAVRDHPAVRAWYAPKA